MIKRMATCNPKVGVDADQFWNYQKCIVARDCMRILGKGVKRYLFSRITKVISGDPRFYDLTEFCYEDEEAMAREYEMWSVLTVLNGKNLYDDYVMWVTDNCSSVMEEFVVKDDSPKVDTYRYTNKLIKRGTACSLKEGVNGDEFWEYHTQVHAPALLKASGLGLKKYAISRINKVANGLGNERYYDITEMYWDSEKSMNKDYEVWKATLLPNGRSVFDSLDCWVTNISSFLMEEFIVKEYGLP